MVEGGMKLIKYLLFAFNLIFVIAAIALIAVGAYVQLKLTNYYDFIDSSYANPGILLIVVGAFIFLIAFFGCMGAFKENYCLTMSFAVLLAIIFIMMIAGGIAAYVFRNQIESEVSKKMTDAEKNYNSSEHQGVTKAWDTLQRDFTCCGVKNASDWEEQTAAITSYPVSCCIDESNNCPVSFNSVNNLKKDGCEKAFADWVKDKVAIIGGVGVGLAFVMVVGILFACCLARAIRKEYEVV